MPNDDLLDLRLGRRYVDRELVGVLVDVHGASVGLAPVTGFTHMGNGDYLCVLSTPDGFVGGLRVELASAPGEAIITVGLTPSEEISDLLLAIPAAIQGISDGVEEQLSEFTDGVEAQFSRFADDLTQRIMDSIQSSRVTRPGVVRPAIVSMPQALPGRVVIPLPVKRKA